MATRPYSGCGSSGQMCCVFAIRVSRRSASPDLLTDQVDWDTALREDNGNVNPLGLYDLDRNIRPVVRAYKQMIDQWQDLLPAQSICLTVPIVLPDDYNDPSSRRRRQWLAEFHKSRRASTEASTPHNG